jgi:2-hydroxychromene-2-carboxylate isomerase
MSPRPLQFWFEFGSTYSYLSVSRIESVAAAADVPIEWRPFLLGPIFREQGWNDSPFNIYPAKGRYMWRDMERLCRKYRLPLRRPSRFPRNGLLAARVACAVRDEAWCGGFVRAVFHANFAEDREISDEAVIAAILDQLGQPSAETIARAQSTEVKERLRRETEEAGRLGIFGAPSFVIDGELFWGNDRLEEAIDWCKRAH